MEYEAYEPDIEDEFYEELCEATYAMMFEGGDNNANPEADIWDFAYC